MSAIEEVTDLRVGGNKHWLCKEFEMLTDLFGGGGNWFLVLVLSYSIYLFLQCGTDMSRHLMLRLLFFIWIKTLMIGNC